MRRWPLIKVNADFLMSAAFSALILDKAAWQFKTRRFAPSLWGCLREALAAHCGRTR
ncbi:MAG: hypothetical protein ACJ8FY_05700 [Gemmataceae bacterium]